MGETRLHRPPTPFRGTMKFDPREATLAALKEAGTNLAGLGCFVVVLGPLYLLAVSIFGGMLPASIGQPADLAKADQDLLVACQTTFFPQADVRLEHRGLGNVRVYIERRDFQTIAYPDRDAALDKLGEAWCANANVLLSPSVSVRDLRNGEELGHCSCIWLALKRPFSP